MRNLCGALLLAAFAFGGPSTAAAVDAGRMQTLGVTSQPIGHYDFCKRYQDMCGVTQDLGPLRLNERVWNRVVAVNEAVNRAVVPVTDREAFGREEYWEFPTTAGDCEDFVLLKKYMLEREGIPSSNLLVTVVRQTNGEGHAVLTVRTDRGDFVLDNLDERVLLWVDTDYQYLKRQAHWDAGKWVTITDDRDVLVGSVAR